MERKLCNYSVEIISEVSGCEPGECGSVVVFFYI